MGRRSTHTPEELRALIIQSAHDIIATDGIREFSAREVARKIGYSPGTLYNLFTSLDDLVLHVEGLVIDALNLRIAELPTDGSPEKRLRAIARTYSRFCHERPRLWNLIFQHTVPPDINPPAWYLERFENLIAHIEQALAPLIPSERRSPEALRRATRVLWAGVNGIVSLTTAEKLAGLATHPPESMVDDFVTHYLAGLALNGP